MSAAILQKEAQKKANEEAARLQDQAIAAQKEADEKYAQEQALNAQNAAGRSAAPGSLAGAITTQLGLPVLLVAGVLLVLILKK